LDFFHFLRFIKITTFRKLDLVPFSGKIGRNRKLGPLVELASGPGLRLAQPGGPTARVSVLPILPEDGRRSSFRNIVILLKKKRRWTKSKKPLLQIITHHSQNPLDFI
jgi:hypothetical protein